MPDDQLRLTAVVVDQFSGPLKRLNTDLTGIANHPGAKTIAKDWKLVGDQIGGISTGIRTQLLPALTGIGGLSLGAAGGIGAIVTGMRSLSSEAQGLRLFARETGMAVDSVRAFGALGERFGVSADVMKNGVKALADGMYDLRRRWGQAYGELHGMDLGKMVEQMIKAPDMEKALDALWSGLGEVPSPIARKRALRALGLPEDWSAIIAETKGKLGPVMKEILSDIGSMDPALQKASTEFEKNFSKMTGIADRFRIQTLGPLIGKFNEVFEATEKGGIIGGIKKLDQMTPVFPGVSNTPEDVERRLKGRQEALGAVENELRLGGPGAEGTRARRDALVDEIRKLTDELRRMREHGGATVQQQSFGGLGPGGASIQSAGFSGGTGFWGAPSGFRLGGVGSGPGVASPGRSSGVAGPGGASDAGGTLSGDGLRGGPGNVGSWWSAERQQHAIDRLKAGGLSELGARALVARWAGVESGRRGPGDRSPKSGAEGIAQWLGPRKLPGVTDNASNFDGQLDYVLKELKTTEQRAFRQLNNAKTPAEAAVGASIFERAEGYNPSTGRDFFTGATLTTMGKLVGAGASQVGGAPAAPGRFPRLSGDTVSIGDSYANGVGNYGKAMPTIAKDGIGPRAILNNIYGALKKDPDAFKGKTVFLSTGAANDGGRFDEASIRSQALVLKQAGANVVISGVVSSLDPNGVINSGLQKLAADKGIGGRFIDAGTESPSNKGHPWNYDPLRKALLARPDEKPGDAMLGRAFGAAGSFGFAPKLDASGTVNIHLSGHLDKAIAKADTSGMFTNVKVSRGAQKTAGISE